MGEWHSWLNTALAALGLLITGFILPTLRHLHLIRFNELKHMDEKLDSIEKKLDTHINWHLDHR